MSVDKIMIAHALIERGWTQHCYAKDANGYVIDSSEPWSEPEAACFCLSGALQAAGCDCFGPEYNTVARVVHDFFGSSSIPGFNDKHGRTKAQVLDALQKAAYAFRAVA